jgi:enterochelin esterase-like enzyme
VEDEYLSPLTGEPVVLLVYQPPCYDAARVAYPGLFLLHGFPMDERHWVEVGIVAQLEAGLSSGRWPPLLMFMPGVPDELYVRTDGGPGSYEQEFIEGLMPFAAAAYPLEPGRKKPALAGISRGGVWALEIALRHPEEFSAVAAFSPALHVNAARPSYDPFWLVENREPLPESLLLAAGEQEPAFRNRTEALVQALREQGAAPRYLSLEGGHADSTWATGLEPLLDFVTAAWQGVGP